jgi:hypothetical protein
VRSESAAYDAGLLVGDKIVAIGDQPLEPDSLTHAAISHRLGLGDGGSLPVSVVRARSKDATVLYLSKKEEAPGRMDFLWGLLGAAFGEENGALVVVDVVEESNGDGLMIGDVILEVDGVAVRGNSEIVRAKSLAHADAVPLALARGQTRINVLVAKRQYEGHSKALPIPSIGATLDISKGAAVVASVDGTRSQVAEEGVGVGWMAVVINKKHVASMTPFEIEAELWRPHLIVTFASSRGADKTLHLWRDDISRERFSQEAAAVMRRAISPMPCKEFDVLMRSLQTDMVSHNREVAAVFKAIDSAMSGISGSGGQVRLKVDAAAEVVRRQIDECKAVDLLAQFYLMVRLLL